MHIQRLLADIDAGQPYHVGHLPLPSLRIRAQTRATVRADEDDGARATLAIGLQSEGPSVFASPGRGRVMSPVARSLSTTRQRCQGIPLFVGEAKSPARIFVSGNEHPV
jgi:hypothetical protein